MIDLTIKVSCVVVLALLVSALARRRSAALRHWILTTAIVCAALAPLLQPIAPAWHLTIRTPPPADLPTATSTTTSGIRVSGTAPTPTSQPAPPERAPLDLNRLLIWMWAAGAGVCGFVLAAGLLRLSWLTSRAERLVDGPVVALSAEVSRSIGLKRPVGLFLSDYPSLPVTWGFRRPHVILPTATNEWSHERLRVVLLHELAHVQRGDWLTQLAAECLRAVYWFNPLVWFISRRLRQESEQACDDAVLNGGVEGTDYASHLLALARSAAAQRRSFFNGFPAPAMARPSSLERRFSAMLNRRLNRRPISRPARLVTTIAVLMITVLIVGFGAQTFSTFSGSVVDSTNRIVPGVVLILTNAQSQAKYEVRSDKTGRFEFVGLPPGEYSYRASLPGFATQEGTITVSGQSIQRDLTLRVGAMQETITIRGGESSVAAPARQPNARPVTRAEPKPCSAGPVGGTIKAPMKIRNVDPRYPSDLNAAKIGGVVILEVVVDPSGSVSDVTVLRSVNPGLELAAVDAVRQWKYTPTLLNCVPVEVRMNVSANFVSQP